MTSYDVRHVEAFVRDARAEFAGVTILVLVDFLCQHVGEDQRPLRVPIGHLRFAGDPPPVAPRWFALTPWERTNVLYDLAEVASQRVTAAARNLAQTCRAADAATP